MIADCKNHILTCLQTAGLAGSQVFASPKAASRHRAHPRAWIDAADEAAEANPKREARFSDDGVTYRRWRTHTRRIRMLVRIEVKGLNECDATYTAFIQALNATLLHSDSNYVAVEMESVNWYEPEGVTDEVAGVAVVVAFAGGAYRDDEITGFAEVHVEPGEPL